MGQNLPKESEPLRTTWRIDGLLRSPVPAPQGFMPKPKPSYASEVHFESDYGSWSVTRSFSFTSNNSKNGVMDNIRTFIAVSNNNSSSGKYNSQFAISNIKSITVPTGVKIGSGLAYYLPLGENFSAFAQLKPSISRIFTAPQTMLAAGFHVPLIVASTPNGHNVSLKFSAAVDREFHPIMSFTINLTPFTK